MYFFVKMSTEAKMDCTALKTTASAAGLASQSYKTKNIHIQQYFIIYAKDSKNIYSATLFHNFCTILINVVILNLRLGSKLVRMSGKQSAPKKQKK